MRSYVYAAAQTGAPGAQSLNLDDAPRSFTVSSTHWKDGSPMNMHLSLAPLVSLIAGILILVVPRLLNYIVAIYLIVIGLLGLFGGNLNMG